MWKLLFLATAAICGLATWKVVGRVQDEQLVFVVDDRRVERPFAIRYVKGSDWYLIGFTAEEYRRCSTLKPKTLEEVSQKCMEGKPIFLYSHYSVADKYRMPPELVH